LRLTVEQIQEQSAGLEIDHPLGRDLDARPGAGVAAGPGPALAAPESAAPPDFDLLAAPERGLQLFQDDLDGLVGLKLAEIRLAGYSGGDVFPGHA